MTKDAKKVKLQRPQLSDEDYIYVDVDDDAVHLAARRVSSDDISR